MARKKKTQTDLAREFLFALVRDRLGYADGLRVLRAAEAGPGSERGEQTSVAVLADGTWAVVRPEEPMPRDVARATTVAALVELIENAAEKIARLEAF